LKRHKTARNHDIRGDKRNDRAGEKSCKERLTRSKEHEKKKQMKKRPDLSKKGGILAWNKPQKALRSVQ